MTMEWLPAEDKHFARVLTRTNMTPYYDKYGIHWDDEMFDESWLHFDNFEIYNSGQRVGIVRFSHEDNAVYLRDLQIDAHHQNKGAGAATIHFAKQYCQQAAKSELRLRVFSDNPAKALYERLGFVTVGTDDSLIRMATPV